MPRMREAQPLPVFLYGTLLDQDILARLLGRRVGSDELEPARLTGFRRVKARNAPYPVLVSDRFGTVHGCLLLSPTPEDLRRIADYEDDYRAAVLDVITAQGRHARALVYLAREDLYRPSDEPWEPQHWAAEHKEQLLRLLDRWLAEREARRAPAPSP